MRRSWPATRVAATVGLALALSAGCEDASAAGPSRFASYGSEAQCVAAHTLAPAICHGAFANARAEYESKTPAFATPALCRQHYASCMPWPPSAAGAEAKFRPSWDGVDIVDTPTEHSVTPSPGTTGRTIRFAARPLTEQPATLVIRGAGAVGSPLVRGGGPVIVGRPGRPSPATSFTQRAAGTPDRPLPPSAPPPPGSGFRLEDGVLTYPAPERFQPKNLPKVP